MNKSLSIWKHIRNYRFHSIFFRNLLMLLLIVLLPVSVAMYLGYSSYTRLYDSEILRQNETTLTEFMTRADQVFYNTSRQLASMSLSKDVELFLYLEPEAELERIRILNIQQLQRMQMMGTPYIKTVYVYASKSNQVILHSAIVSLEQFRDREMILSYIEQKDNLSLPKVLTSMDMNDVRPKMRISVYYDIYFGDGQKGFAVANISPKDLKEYIDTDPQGDFYIWGNDQILYSSQIDRVGSAISILNDTFPTLEEGIHTANGKKYAVRVSDETGFAYLSVFPDIEYPSEIRVYRNSLHILLIILILLSLFLCIHVSLKMYRPIEAILMRFSDHDVPDIKGMDELKYIVSTIERTEKDKSQIEQELESRIEMLKKAQSIALQAQINPHFINNTLQTINSLAMLRLGAVNEVSSTVNALSGMLSLSLQNTSNIVPLQQEIEHCMLYLEIQEKRYKGRFDVEWDIPDEFRCCKTIKIVLQPIVENCIYHAIKPMSSKGHIRISAAKQGDDLLIQVQDNGLGLQPDQLTELRDNLQSESIRESKHLGLANVHQRIRLYFGESYGVSIDSEAWFGTTVSIRLPRIND